MATPTRFLLGLAGLATLCSATAPSCPVVLDGRVPSTATPALFDTPASPFLPTAVLGRTVRFSQALRLPPLPRSRFDLPAGRPLELAISDASVFAPGPASATPQTGFRRIGLIPAANTGSDPSTTGAKTFHWSVRASANHPLNLTHEYLNVWHETNDFSANQWSFQTGTFIGRRDAALTRDLWKITDRRGEVLFQTKILQEQWQNFAVTVDVDRNTLQIYYSPFDSPLARVGPQTIRNDNAGGGQLQLGILKKPTAPGADVARSGFQPGGIDERIVYGGVFVEDSRGGCVSL